MIGIHLPSSMFEMAPSIFSSSSLRLTTRLISTFKPPISCGRMMSSTTLSDLNNPSPCLMLPPTMEGLGSSMIYNFYNLPQNKVISFNNNKIPGKDVEIVGSSHGWLALFNWRNKDLILTNPVTRRHVKLPPCSERVSKVIISCDAEQDDCQAMMIDYSRRLSFCRPGRSPTEWTPIGAQGICYEDLVYSSRHKLFFCVTEIGSDDYLEGWDVASDPPRLRWENRDDLVGHESYFCLDQAKSWWCETFMNLVFVEQADQLFLVMRHLVRQMAPDGSGVDDPDNYDIYPYKTVAFNVYKIDRELEGGGGMSSVDGGSLDRLAMFVGLNHSFAVLATEANGLKPNSIYFTDDKDLTPECYDDVSKFGGHDIGIFDYENKTISPCYYPCDIQSFKRIMPAPIWFTPTHN